MSFMSFRSPWVYLLYGILCLIALLFWIRRLQKQLSVAKKEGERVRLALEEEAKKSRLAFEAEVQVFRTSSQSLLDKQIAEVREEAARIKGYYEGEVLKIQGEVEHLRRYQGVHDAATAAQEMLTSAEKAARLLKDESLALLESAKFDAGEQKAQAAKKAEELKRETEALLSSAVQDSKRIVAAAEEEAKKIAGDAYVALREKEHLEASITAIHNVIDGYGDRYLVPTRSLLDGLAEHFEHTDAGEALKRAREQTRRMVENGAAAECSYVEPTRRQTAIRFVVDAFNGRVDGILTRSKHDNFGTLEQEIRDTFNLVNLNGMAFRDAKILPAYRGARLEELRWAVSVHALRMQEREEQRRIQEQIREEEKARLEYERAIKEATRDQETLTKALDQARQEVAKATEAQRVILEKQIETLSLKLKEAEARNQRALSMAQQTKAGHVYVISNVGSFGEDVFKIGLTRRLEPEERIWELSNASVPFEYDIHAMIYSENAPDLEYKLHHEFDKLRLNMVNLRKEFFRLPLARIRDFVATNNLKASFTMVAAAREYRETKALAKMTPAEREKYAIPEPSGRLSTGSLEDEESPK